MLSGNLITVYKEIRLLVQSQLGEYRAEVEEQRISRLHLLNIPLFSSLHGHVTTAAIRMLFYELEAARQPDFTSTCRCTLPTTHGLPCAHDVLRCFQAGMPVSLEDINRHWFYTQMHDTMPSEVTGDMVLEPRLRAPCRVIEAEEDNSDADINKTEPLSQSSSPAQDNTVASDANALRQSTSVQALPARRQNRSSLHLSSVGERQRNTQGKFCSIYILFLTSSWKTLLL